MEDEPNLRANPNAVEAPAIAIPETLPLPIAAGAADIGRTGSVIITGGIPIGRRRGCNRAADNRAADDSARNSRAERALGMGGLCG